MKARRKAILDKLSIVERCVPVRTTVPLVGGILFDVKEDSVEFRSTNLEVGIKAFSSDVDVVNGGTVVLPPKIVDILRQSPEEDVEIKMDESNFRTEIKSGKANFFLYGMAPEEFPRFTDDSLWSSWNRLTFSAGDFRDILKKITFAVSHDEGKHAFRGILFESAEDNSLSFISSDTYRLAYYKREFTEREMSPFRILVPGRILNEIMKVLEEAEENVGCYFSDSEMVVSYKDIVFFCRLLENKFPNLSGVFPGSSSSTVVEVNARMFEDTIRRASLLAHGYNNMISIFISDGTLGVKAGSEMGRMDEELSLESKEGADLDEILINSRFILDLLRVWEKDLLKVEFNGPLGPCIFIDHKEGDGLKDSYRYLILPIKTDKKQHE